MHDKEYTPTLTYEGKSFNLEALAEAECTIGINAVYNGIAEHHGEEYARRMRVFYPSFVGTLTGYAGSR